jgi:hypothetical protein
MGEQEINRTSPIDEILNAAKDMTDGKFNYANSVRVSVSANEATLDFYSILPSDKIPKSDPEVQRFYRILIPISVAKDLANVLMQTTSSWESLFGISLPLEPDPNKMTKDSKDE